MKTFINILLTIFAIQFAAWVLTVIYLVATNGYHSIAPLWFNIWSFFTLVLPTIIFLIRGVILAIQYIWDK